jgi:uncharacterized protein (DUF608 family)
MTSQRIEMLAFISLGALAALFLGPADSACSEPPHGIAYEGALGAPLGMALGGLGTSTLEIGRDGAFQNVRVQNDWSEPIPPTPAGTFLAVHARTKSGKKAGRLLQLAAPEGLDPVAALTYRGRFPAVEIAYRDPGLPCHVTLEAFSPFVPHDAAASSLPLVFFTFRLRNPGPEPITAAVAISWVNDIAAETQRGGWPSAGNQNSTLAGSQPAVLLGTRMAELAGSEYLLACLPAEGVRYHAVADWWRRPAGRWLGPNVKTADQQAIVAWRRFLDEGILPAESGHDDGLGRFSPHRPVAAVAGEVDLAPGAEREVRMALAWYFPYHWDRRTTKAKILLGHQYAVRFPKGARDVAAWAFPQRDTLRRRSLAWRSLIEESSLPPKCRALATEILYLLPRLSWWLADGRFVLHESINCPRIHPTLLDIYTAPVMAALFPELHASSLRTIAACQLANGEIPSTLGVWSVHQHEYRVFNPGDASVFPIVAAWEILWGGDAEFARQIYPVVKKVLQWGERELDADRDGIVDVHGIDQGWDTFPMHGAAAYIADQWIAALLAGETLARRFDDAPFAAWCAAIRKKASATTENLLWNGKYYDLAHDPLAGTRSDICFADQFTYGTVAAGILGLGDVHPRERVRRSLETIWLLNVRPCQFVCRMGSNADGTPADSSVHQRQKGAASQSNCFTPVSTAPLAAAAIQHGMIGEGLTLVEATADVILNRVKGPWSGELLFDSRNGRCFYGLHYSDCLILWDVMYALLGAQVDASQHRLCLAPPRVPVKIPLFGRLYTGQVEFTPSGRSVELRLTNFADSPTSLRTLTVRLPKPFPAVKCTVEQDAVGAIHSRPGSESVLNNVLIPPHGELRVRWD